MGVAYLVVLKPGEVLAGYRIERLLGAGGMGSVYLASHPSLPRRDAVKVLSAELSRDPDFRARFLREADVAAGLDHPNIVSVYDRGQTDDEQLWIAMQFVDGTDADAALRAGTMTPERAVHIVAGVAAALDLAHSRNIVHRDVKPANFLLTGSPGPSERVLLGDFGIARALDDAGLTVTGSVVATVAYAAPEVLTGNPFDGRADIYSLGCTLLRLLTGKTPFSSANGMAAVMMAHLQQPPPRVTDFVASLPPALDAVIAVAMAKDPRSRFPTATALADAAADALRDSRPLRGAARPPVAAAEVSSYPQVGSARPDWWVADGPRTQMAPPAPAPPRRRVPLLAAAAAGLAVIVAAVATVALWPRESTDRASSNPTGTTTDTAESTRLAPTTTAPAGPPATNVAQPQLPSILLTQNQIATMVGGPPLLIDSDSSTLLPDASIDNPQCLAAWSPAQQSVYASAGATGTQVQILRAMGAPVWQDGLIQAVTALDSQGNISLFIQGQQRQWAACAQGGPVTVTPAGGPAQTWTFTPPVTTAGIVTLTATSASGDGSCSRGIAVRGNVVIDARLCRPGGTADIAAIVRAIGDQVPRQ
ncbi:serine/threonine protein kinase [Mycolicibacterium litorale]|nr:serine/threonine protein kinase [Mycolicibacterium litorale]